MPNNWKYQTTVGSLYGNQNWKYIFKIYVLKYPEIFLTIVNLNCNRRIEAGVNQHAWATLTIGRSQTMVRSPWLLLRLRVKLVFAVLLFTLLVKHLLENVFKHSFSDFSIKHVRGNWISDEGNISWTYITVLFNQVSLLEDLWNSWIER